MIDKLRYMLTHSAFWLAACSIVLNLAPFVIAELTDYPRAMRGIRIVVASVWIAYLALNGKLPEPTPPPMK